MADGREAVVHCGECGHSWIAAHLPMDASKFAKVLMRAICPMCAETKVFMGKGESHANPGA